MLIEFRCTNLSQYDAATGRYVECGHILVESDENIGQLVTCKKCGQTIEVPFDYADRPVRDNAADRRTPDRRTPERRTNKRQKKPVQAEQKLVASKGGAKKSPQAKSGKVQRKTQTSGVNKPAPKQASSRNTRNAGSGLARTDVMGMEFGPDSTNVHQSNRDRCPECGSLIDDFGKCSLCRYVVPKFRSKTAEINEIQIQLAGFQLWLSDIVSEGASVQVIKWGLVVLVTILYLVMAIAGVIIGQVWSFVSVGLFTMAYVVFLLAILKAQQLAREPRAKLGWLAPAWLLVLIWCRFMGWKRYDSRLANRLIINRNNSPITDEKILQLENLKKCQVLELENTMISDLGLLHLYGLSQLQCLVVRRSKVSHEGIFRLQQAHPRMWIWY